MSRYVRCAKEMNEVMGLDPAIDTKLEEEELKEAIKSNAEEVVPTDKFSDETWDVIEEVTEKKVHRPSNAEKKNTKKATNSNTKIDSNSNAVKPANKTVKNKEENKGPSNKFQVYQAWKNGIVDSDKLIALVEGRVKKNTIQLWTRAWKHGKDFPAGVK